MWTFIKENNILSNDKIKIAQHKATNKILIGAKNSGKTYLAEVDLIVQLEQDSNFNAWCFRKYKTQSNEKLADYFFKALQVLNQNGYATKNKWKQISRGQKISSNKNKSKPYLNQTISFGSLEKLDSTNGAVIPNGGYFGMTIIDEPITANDISMNAINQDKDNETYERMLKIIRDDLSRFHKQYEETHDKKPYPFTIYQCLNPWWNHKLIQDANKIFPEDDFIYYIFQYNIGKPDSKISLQDLLDNDTLVEEWFSNKENIDRILNHNTMSVYDKENDTLYARMTKFANPNNQDQEKAKQILQDIKMSIFLKNKNALCMLLGLEHKPDINKDMLVYNIKDFNNITKDELQKDKWEPMGIAYSVDIDTSRVLTITPAIKYRKVENNIGYWKVSFRIFIDKQIEIPAYGTGIYGELNEKYVELISKKIKEHYINNNFIKIKLKTKHLAVDDKRKWYLLQLSRSLGSFLTTFDTFWQHGDYNIIARQDWTQLGFENKVLFLHPENKALEDDFKTCLKDDIQSPKRKTTGNTNYLDRIDSMENSFLPFVGVIINSRKD